MNKCILLSLASPVSNCLCLALLFFFVLDDDLWPLVALQGSAMCWLFALGYQLNNILDGASGLALWRRLGLASLAWT